MSFAIPGITGSGKKPLMALLLCLSSLKANVATAESFYDRLLHAKNEPQNWLTYSGGYSGWRFSPLQEITAGNVSSLAVAWIFQTGAVGKFETTPLVIDGIMYVTAQNNLAFALDARTGRPLWRYQRRLPEKVSVCCGQVNHGFAASEGKVFMATLDAHLVALDAKTGNVIWDVEAEDYRHGYAFTVAPLVVKDKVIVGVSGGEFGIRGFIDAYDVARGKRAWRFYTVPAPGEPGSDTWPGDRWKKGGGSAWLNGTYDPELNLIYWGTGNPGPDFNGEERKGDNLFSDSMVALDADSGKLKWHFQFTPHDVHDWDATQVPVLLDLKVEGKPQKLLAQANRNGFYYVLDRTNGKFLFAKPLVRVTWAERIGADGRPVLLLGSEPKPEGNYVCPGSAGATNWMSPSYSPQTGLFYVAVREQCDKYFSSPQPYREGTIFAASVNQPVTDVKDWGALRALDPRTGETEWEFKYYSAPWAGVLSTAGGLVFAADIEGYLMAFDATTGRELWHLQTGSAVYASPMSYAIDGRQYVAIASGSALLAFALPGRGSMKEVSGTKE
jgi:alcohol dehydrogenase (cytochrome c)